MLCLKLVMNVCCCTVAARLIAKSEVICYGQKMSITSYTSVTSASPSALSETWQSVNISDSAVSESPIEHLACGGMQTCTAIICSDSTEVDTDDYYNLYPGAAIWSEDVATATCQSHGPSDSELCVADCLKLSDTTEPVHIDSLQSLQTCADDTADEELTETDDNCKLSHEVDEDNIGNFVICKCDVVEQDSEMSVDLQRSQRQNEVVCEQPGQNVKLKSPSSKQTQKLYFSEEKLCLLDKIITSGNIEFPCTVQVIMAEKAVELVAADEDVTEAEIKLHELIANFSSVWLHLPQGVVKLLQSSRGQKWLKKQLSSLDAIFYAKDSTCPCIIGVDSSASSDAKFLLESTLSSKKIPFDDHHVTFLRSAQWATAVDKFECEYFVAVSTQYRENDIVVEGSVEALNDVGKTVETLLRQNGKVERKITMSAECFQLLMLFKVEICDRLKSEVSPHRYMQLLLVYCCVYT